MQPLKIDPASTVDVWLAAYDDAPADTRPAFTMTFPSARKMREVWALEDEASEASKRNDAGGYIDKLKAAILVGLRGFRNIDAKPEDVDDLLKPAEMRELLDRWEKATRLGADEKKPCPSSASEASSTAPGAVAASASTPPASSSASSSGSSAQPAAAT